MTNRPKALTIGTQPRTLDAIARMLSTDPRIKSVHSRRGYLTDLRAFEQWRGPRPLTKLLVEEYAAHLQHAGRSPGSINRVLASVRWWARKVADIAHEDTTLTPDERRTMAEQALRVAAVKNVSGTRRQKGRHISPGELAALMRACTDDDTPAGVRDAAIIALAWNTGARRSEIANLKLSDVKWTDDTEADVTIRGKGDKVRSAYIFNGTATALRDWLNLRGEKAGPLFYGVDKSGQVVTTKRAYGLRGQLGVSVTHAPGVSDNALAQMLDKRAAEAELSEPITWHDFRRTFAGNLLDSGSDLATVQRLMGHSSPITTSNYDRRGEDTKRRAVRVLHVPYRKRTK
jgi:site-specific recombinase XerD